MPKKSSTWDKIKGPLYTGGGIAATDIIFSILNALPGGKDGGRVTPKGIGKATHGFGKAMKKKKK
jgi:hypothetical protein